MNKSKLYLEQLNKLKNKIHQSKIDEQVVPKEVEAADRKRRKEEEQKQLPSDYIDVTKTLTPSFTKPEKYKPWPGEIGPVDPLEAAAAARMQAGIEHARSTEAMVHSRLGWPVFSGAKPVGETSKRYYESEKRLKSEIENAKAEGRVDPNDPRLKDYLKSVRVNPDYLGHMSDAAFNLAILGGVMSQGAGIKIPGSQRATDLAKQTKEIVGQRISSAKPDLRPPAQRVATAIETDIKSGTLPGMYDPELGRYTTQVGVNPPQPVDASKPNLPAKKGGRDVGYPSMPPEHVATPPKPEGPMTVQSTIKRAMTDPDLARISTRGSTWNLKKKISTPEDKPKFK
jgi:hypothetical protein